MNIKQTYDHYSANPEQIPSIQAMKEMVLSQQKNTKNLVVKLICHIQLKWVASLEKDIAKIKKEISIKRVFVNYCPIQTFAERCAVVERFRKENPKMLRIFSDLTEEEQTVLIDWASFFN